MPTGPKNQKDDKSNTYIMSLLHIYINIKIDKKILSKVNLK